MKKRKRYMKKGNGKNLVGRRISEIYELVRKVKGNRKMQRI